MIPNPLKNPLKLSPFLVVLFGIPFCTPFIAGGDPDLGSLRLPEGFEIHVYAGDVPNARSMVLGDKGTLFVATRGEGKVYAIEDEDGDFKADQVHIIAKGLRMPNGVAFKDGSLYVAEISRVIRFDQIENHLKNPPAPVVIRDDFPTDRHHGWKYIAFGPDGKLYVPVGAPCNICESERSVYATIMRMNKDGSDLEIFASGVRNSVGFTWHPETAEMWFTDNGGDNLGDDMPPDELNRAPTTGLHFGYPYCHGGDFADPDFGKKRDCKEFVPPAQKLGPHVAALGLIFYTGDMFPEAYRNQLLIAEHGSWNRSKPIGYRVMQVKLNGNKALSYEPFIEGWLEGNNAWGRPVALLQMPDGSVLLSDDHADMIYRITYRK